MGAKYLKIGIMCVTTATTIYGKKKEKNQHFQKKIQKSMNQMCIFVHVAIRKRNQENKLFTLNQKTMTLATR